MKLGDQIRELPNKETRARDDGRQSFHQISLLVLNGRNIEEAHHHRYSSHHIVSARYSNILVVRDSNPTDNLIIEDGRPNNHEEIEDNHSLRAVETAT